MGTTVNVTNYNAPNDHCKYGKFLYECLYSARLSKLLESFWHKCRFVDNKIRRDISKL